LPPQIVHLADFRMRSDDASAPHRMISVQGPTANCDCSRTDHSTATSIMSQHATALASGRSRYIGYEASRHADDSPACGKPLGFVGRRGRPIARRGNERQ
jgi:hypothetical protein